MDFFQAPAERIQFHGWDAVRISNGLIGAVFVPELGGRLLQFSLGEHDYLYINPELLGKRFTYEEHAGDGTIMSWKNYGGDKTWPAPQGWDNDEQWHGPPDPVLDSGRYDHHTNESHNSGAITMTSPTDPRTGLQITREISLETGNSRLTLDLSFMNFAERTVRWSIWDVAQLACSRADGSLNDDCWLYIPIDADREPPYSVIFGDDNPQYQLDAATGMLAVQYQGMVGKIGVHSPAGWFAFVDHAAEMALCMRFDYQPDAEYPDNGSTVECWTESPGAPSPIEFRSPGYILEAEVLSPLHTLHPYDDASQRVIWSAAQCPGPIVDVNDVGCVNQPLTVDVTQAGARVAGVFGCFLEGNAQLAALDAAGAVLTAIDLGAVSPLAALRVDETVSLPEGACQFRLDVLDADGAVAGALSSVALSS